MKKNKKSRLYLVNILVLFVKKMVINIELLRTYYSKKNLYNYINRMSS